MSDGLWRRMYRVNFEHQVPEEKQDSQLPTKLEQELPGILNWALAGLREYNVAGLQVPVAVVSAVAQYRHDQNPLREFLEAKYDLTENPDDQVAGTELVRQYNGWAKGLRIRSLSSQALGMAMRSLQMTPKKTMHGVVYVGIKVNPGIQVGW